MSPRKQRPAKSDIVFTERALADLRQIERYSAKEWGRKAADRYLDAVAAALDLLRENPGILRQEPCFAPDLYFYRVKKHLLVCDFHGHLVTVLTVIHTSMDVPRRLMELEPRLIAEAQFLQQKLRKYSGPD